MGTVDIVTKEYMRENAIFADAFNYLIYGGTVSYTHLTLPTICSV